MAGASKTAGTRVTRKRQSIAQRIIEQLRKYPNDDYEEIADAHGVTTDYVSALARKASRLNLDQTKKLPDTSCVVQVRYGRGFVVGTDDRRFVLTAAHCLPNLPPAHAFSYLEDRTYENLVGPLGGKRTVWAECLFADPVADIAVLGAPDNQELCDEAEAFENLVNNRRPLRMGKAKSGDGWMLSLENHWVPTRIAVWGSWNAALEIGPTEGGQSGSPILNRSGQAIGVIVVGSETLNRETGQTTNERSAGNPILTCALPGWLLELLTGRSKGAK